MNFVDDVLAYRIVTLLVTPFDQFQAYKLKIIDENGKQLKIPTTSEEKNAWTVLTRVIVRIKRAMLHSSIPTTLASLAAAYWLVKESYDAKKLLSLKENVRIYQELADNAVEYLPLEEMLIVESMVDEDSPVNNTTGIAGEHEPVITPNQAKRYREFNVSQETFAKFSKGKRKFQRWDTYLNLENEEEQALYQYARKTPRGIIVLKHEDQSRAIRFNRRGGGNWHKIRRQIKENVNLTTIDVTVFSCQLEKI
jgi:hypothetical protein